MISPETEWVLGTGSRLVISLSSFSPELFVSDGINKQAKCQITKDSRKVWIQYQINLILFKYAVHPFHSYFLPATLWSCTCMPWLIPVLSLLLRASRKWRSSTGLSMIKDAAKFIYIPTYWKEHLINFRCTCMSREICVCCAINN